MLYKCFSVEAYVCKKTEGVLAPKILRKFLAELPLIVNIHEPKLLQPVT